MHIFHKWERWGNPEVTEFLNVYSDKKFNRSIQRRICKKCGYVQERKVD